MSGARLQVTLAALFCFGFSLSLLVISTPWVHVGGRWPYAYAIPVLGLTTVAAWAACDWRLEVDRNAVRDSATVLVLILWVFIALEVADAQFAEGSFFDEGSQRLYQFSLLFAASVGATLLLVQSSAWRYLPFAALLFTVAAWTSFWLVANHAGVSVFGSFEEAIRSRQAQPVFRLFRATFTGSDLEYLENMTAPLRHQTVRGGLVASLLSGAAYALCPPKRGRWLAWLGIGAGPIIAVLTLSRSNLALAGAVVLLACAWTVKHRRLGAALAGGLVVALAVALAGLFVFVEESTGSAATRSARVAAAIELLDDGLVSGVERTAASEVGRSTHNTFLDLWLGGGVVAALAGVLMMALGGFWTIRAARWALEAPSPVSLLYEVSVFGLFLNALLRMLVGGGGLLDQVSWVGLGIAICLATSRSPDSGANRPLVQVGRLMVR